MLGLLRQVDLLGLASSRKRSFYDESLLPLSTLSGGESSSSLRLLSASLIGSRSGEATASTTAPLPRLASGKASTLLASLALACAKA